MGYGRFDVSGPVLRDLLGLPADAVVESVTVEVEHPRIRNGYDINPTFTRKLGRQTLKSWGHSKRKPQKPISSSMLQVFDELVGQLTKDMRLTAMVNRSYEKESSGAPGVVIAKLPPRYRR